MLAYLHISLSWQFMAGFNWTYIKWVLIRKLGGCVDREMAKLLEPDVSTRLLRVTNAFNDVLYSCANEPSLGMYRIQEHVTISVPRLVEQQQQLRESLRRVEGASYDLEYDSKTLVDMSAITQFGSIKNK